MWIIPALFVKDVQLSFPLLSPKGKVNIFVWKSFLENHTLISTCHFLLMLPWSAPDVSVHSILFQQRQVVHSGSVAVLSLEPRGHWSSQFIPFRWSHNTISNPEAVPHTAVWGWMLKVPCGCRSCWASEKSVSKCKRIHQSLLRTPLTFVFKGIWVAVLKPRRLRGQQPSFLAPTNSYHVSDSRDTGAGKRERTPPGSSLC